jgi:choline kinase
VHRAIILAAGRGSRMKHHTDCLPKCMLQLQGKPLISHQITALQAAGIDEIGLVCGYLKDKIDVPGITQRFENNRWHETNIVRSLMAAFDWLEQSDCIISYADIFYSSSAVTSLIECHSDIAITYDMNFKKLWTSRFSEPLADLETFRINSNYYLTEIGSRPSSLDEIQGQYMGLLKFTQKGWQKASAVIASMVPDWVDKLDMTLLLQKMIKSEYLIRAVPYAEQWGEIDCSSDLGLFSKYILPLI